MKREFLYEIKKPIVLWISSDILVEIIRKAPDFWAFRSRTFEFKIIEEL